MKNSGRTSQLDLLNSIADITSNSTLVKMINKLLIALLLLSSCKKNHTPEPFHFNATISGKSVRWTAPDQNSTPANGAYGALVYEDVEAVTGSNCVVNKCYDVRIGTNIFGLRTNSPNVSNMIRVYFVEGIHQWWGNYDPMMSSFAPGNKAFGKDRVNNTEPAANGIVVVYYDATGKMWRSDDGPQSGSSFESQLFLDNQAQIHYKKRWKAKFNCSLYNGSQTISVNDAEIYGPVYQKQ
jgi:hypothetical protein